MQSTTLPLPGDPRWRRLVGVALFLALIYAFRHLAPVFICFVVLERCLGWAADQIERRANIHKKGAIAATLTALAAALGLVVFLAVRRALPYVAVVRSEGPGYLASLGDQPAIARLREMAGLENESLGETVKHHAMTAVHYATATAHVLIYLLIGFVLAVIYLFERDEVDRWLGELHPASVGGTMSRWFGYVGDAITVTLRMQVVVAVVSAVVTLPVLLLLRLPHIPLLFLLLLVSGLLPVVGNMISGAVLCFVAYEARGAWAVAVFLGVTFVLHKIESYYLNPRLAREHVKLPGLLLVVSLLLFEQVFGFLGLFLSFPALYVALKIGHEWKEAEVTG
jgi:putative heme transporter